MVGAYHGFRRWLWHTGTMEVAGWYSAAVAPFFSAGQHAVGFIAVGQIATGVIAFGQVATGFIAVGQVARGGIAIGMAAIGLVAIGMVGVGVIAAGGMVGVGGRSLFGFVLELMPVPRKPHAWPRMIRDPAELFASRRGGWLMVDFALTGDGVIQMSHTGRPVRARVSAELARAARSFASMQQRGLAFLVPQGQGDAGAAPSFVCTRIMELPRGRRFRLASWILGALRLVLLAGLAYAVWRFAILPVGDALWT